MSKYLSRWAFIKKWTLFGSSIGICLSSLYFFVKKLLAGNVEFTLLIIFLFYLWYINYFIKKQIKPKKDDDVDEEETEDEETLTDDYFQIP